MNTTTAVATKSDLRVILNKPETIQELARVATKYLTADRLARLILTACHRVPALLQCTPQSVLQCAMTCSQYGVEPDGRHAHLIPYGTQCTLIIDWKGLVALGRRGGVEGIVSDTICEHDEFTYYRDEAGTHFRHVPKFGGRGEIIGAYSTAKIDGAFDVEVVTKEEIDGIRARSKAGRSGPWVTDYGEMAKKTAIRRHSKRWPLAPEIAEAFLSDDDVLDNAKPVAEIKRPIFAAPKASFAALPPQSDDNLPGMEPSVSPALPAQEAPSEPESLPQSAAPVSDAPAPVRRSRASTNPLQDLTDLVIGAGYTFDQLKTAVATLGWVGANVVDVYADFSEVPVADAAKWLGARKTLLKQLEAQKLQ